MSAAEGLTWEQVATLQPRLVADARVHRHSYRGVPWYVVQDGATATHVRLAEGAWRIAGLMDGQRSLAQIHASLCEVLGDNAPAREDIAGVLQRLHTAELIDCEQLAGAEQFGARQRSHARLRWRRLLASPVSQRIPLVNPQRFLTRWLPTVKPLVCKAVFFAWLAVLVLGIVGTTANWHAISAAFSTDVLRPNNLLLMAVAYLVVKTLHELAHAFVARAFGAEVREMGIMLLVFVPVPYVDASASSAFAPKAWRMAVGAAGIMVEMFLAVLALGVWLSVEPGLVRDLAFSFMIVGGVSTLLFNGNPLLRFDGYYVLCDAIEIPNLGSRSARYLGYLVHRYLLGVNVSSPVSVPGERPWFVGYGIASFLYRLVILVAIVLFVAERYPLAGLVIAVWITVVQYLLPAGRAVARIASAAEFAGRRKRAAVLLGLPLLLAGLAAATVPLPAWTHAEGVIWLPEGAQARAGADGFVIAQRARNGATVAAGEPLFALQSERLQASVATLEHRLEEHQARYDVALFQDRSRLQALGQQLIRTRAELASAQEQAAGLLVRSPGDGTLEVTAERRLNGRFVRKGETLAFVTDGRAQTTRVVLRQDEIDRVREDTQAVRVRLPGFAGSSYRAKVKSAVPSASGRLPAAALGVQGGGRIAVIGGDPDGLTPTDSIFIVDVTLPDDAPRLAAGTRVYLRFVHAPSPMVTQAVRALRQLFLARFGV